MQVAKTLLLLSGTVSAFFFNPLLYKSNITSEKDRRNLIMNINSTNRTNTKDSLHTFEDTELEDIKKKIKNKIIGGAMMEFNFSEHVKAKLMQENGEKFLKKLLLSELDELSRCLHLFFTSSFENLKTRIKNEGIKTFLSKFPQNTTSESNRQLTTTNEVVTPQTTNEVVPPQFQINRNPEELTASNEVPPQFQINRNPEELTTSNEVDPPQSQINKKTEKRFCCCCGGD